MEASARAGVARPETPKTAAVRSRKRTWEGEALRIQGLPTRRPDGPEASAALAPYPPLPNRRPLLSRQHRHCSLKSWGLWESASKAGGVRGRGGGRPGAGRASGAGAGASRGGAGRPRGGAGRPRAGQRRPGSRGGRPRGQAGRRGRAGRPGAKRGRQKSEAGRPGRAEGVPGPGQGVRAGGGVRGRAGVRAGERASRGGAGLLVHRSWSRVASRRW